MDASTPSRIAVVGAGVAGAGAAYALRDSPAEVVVFEAADAVGGRTATAARGGCRYDYWANYVKDGGGSDHERVRSLLRRLGPGLVEATGPVWTFDANGTVEPGRDPDEHKWTFRDGIQTVASRLLDRAGATVRTGAPVSSLRREGGRWRVDRDGRDGGTGEADPWDAVLLTPPGPATAALLPDGAEPLEGLKDAAQAVPYREITSVALHYPFEVARPYYALVNVDRAHPIGWLSRESCKPGHVPEGESVLIAQMAPDWSAAHRDAADALVIEEAANHAAELLGDDRLGDPDWATRHHAKRALPDGGLDADAEVVEACRAAGVYVAGDWVAGEGRVHRALRSGLDAGARVADRIDGD